MMEKAIRDTAIHKTDVADNQASVHPNQLSINDNPLIDLSFDSPSTGGRGNGGHFEGTNLKETKDRQSDETAVCVPENCVVTINGKQYIKHFIVFTDNLQGIALKYHVKVDDIKVINKLIKDEDLYTRVTLYVPYHGQKIQQLDDKQKEHYVQQMKKRLANRFMMNTNCSCMEEAAFYLESNKYEYPEAIKTYQEDLHWETLHKLPQSKSQKSH